MAESRDDPSLLRFVLERLDDEEEAIILNTPFFPGSQIDEDFLARFVGRRPLLDRVRGDRHLVTACVESMRRVQGPPRVATPVNAPDEATVLGSQIIKLIASRFAWHPDYQAHWQPGS